VNIKKLKALLLAVLLSGCNTVIQNLENDQLRQDTEIMLDALIADDFQSAYSLFQGVCTEAEFAPAFREMRSLVEGADAYTLNLLSVSANTNITNGVKLTTSMATYHMEFSSGRMIINVRADSRQGLTSFYLTPFEKTDYYFTGTIGSMKDAGVGQWIVLFSNLLSLVFAVFALIDCCRNKLEKKVMWILLIIFGFITLGTTISATGFRTNFSIGWILGYSALIRYGSGTFSLRLLVPAGAAAYLLTRRSLLRKPASGTDQAAN